jgi:UrcA family protein
MSRTFLEGVMIKRQFSILVAAIAFGFVVSQPALAATAPGEDAVVASQAHVEPSTDADAEARLDRLREEARSACRQSDYGRFLGVRYARRACVEAAVAQAVAASQTETASSSYELSGAPRRSALGAVAGYEKHHFLAAARAQAIASGDPCAASNNPHMDIAVRALANRCRSILIAFTETPHDAALLERCNRAAYALNGRRCNGASPLTESASRV